jgi:hypothetical protein
MNPENLKTVEDESFGEFIHFTVKQFLLRLVLLKLKNIFNVSLAIELPTKLK